MKHSLSVQKNRALGNSQLFPARPYPKMQEEEEEEEEFRILFFRMCGKQKIGDHKMPFGDASK